MAFVCRWRSLALANRVLALLFWTHDITLIYLTSLSQDCDLFAAIFAKFLNLHAST
jgi:hypothetical protein